VNPWRAYRESGGTGAARRAARALLRRPGRWLLNRSHLARPDDWLYPTSEVRLHRNLELRDRHRGRPAFVIAEGGLPVPTPARLGEHVTIATDAAWRQLPRGWRCSYAIVQASEANPAPGLPDPATVYLFAANAAAGDPTASERFAGSSYWLAVADEVQIEAATAIEMAHVLPRPPCEAQLGIMFAIYLGCSPIYLVGAKHRWLQRPFDPRGLLLRPSELARPVSVYHHLLLSTLRVWTAYECLREVAARCGSSIIDTTPSGFLDLFPQTSLEAAL